MMNARDQFIQDCGNDMSVVSIAVVMLIDTRTITIDDSIVWSLLKHGFSQRTEYGKTVLYSNHGFISTEAHYEALDWRNESLSSWTKWVWENI
jgi:Holliday junction resolvasome RuvABC ATP-dependent DNA helicase subunit